MVHFSMTVIIVTETINSRRQGRKNLQMKVFQIYNNNNNMCTYTAVHIHSNGTNTLCIFVYNKNNFIYFMIVLYLLLFILIHSVPIHLFIINY